MTIRKILRHATLANAGALLFALAAPVFAVDDISEAEMLRKLSAPLPASAEEPAPVFLTRGIRHRPDPNTNRCENSAPAPQSTAPARRSLYVEDAPSIDLAINFNHGAATLTPDSRRTLDSLAKVLKSADLQRDHFVIAGHTNKVGQDEFNKHLSCARAISVRNYLRDTHGIQNERLVTMGFGFDRLKTPESPESDENRRVEIRKSGS